MSKFLQFLPADIVKYWDTISYVYSKSAFLTEKDNIPKMLQNTLLDLLSGKRQCWALLDDELKFKVFMGIKVVKNEMNLESITSLVVGPLYGFEPTTTEEKLFIFERIQQYKKNIKADSIYFYSPLPIVWNVAEKMGMKFISKIYTDKIYGGEI